MLSRRSYDVSVPSFVLTPPNNARRARSLARFLLDTRSESMLGRGFAVLCSALVSLLVAPVSGASQDWTATKPALNMQAALESGVPANRPVTMLATKKGDGTRPAVIRVSAGEFSPPRVAGDWYKVVEAATDTSEKVRNVCTLNTLPHSATHAKISTEVRPPLPLAHQCSHTGRTGQFNH